MKKILLILIFLTSFGIVFAQSPRVFEPRQGGTGIGSATSGDIGTCLKVLDDSPFTYELGTCGGGGGGGGDSVFSRTVGGLIYAPTTTDSFAIGSTATSTAEFWFDPINASSSLSHTIQKSLNNYTIYADQMSGSTVGAKLQAATDALPVTGGIVDARNLKGTVGSHDINQANFNLGRADGRPITYLFGPGTTTLNSAVTDINVFDNVTIVGHNTIFAARPTTGITNSGRFFSASSTSVTGSITAGSKVLTVSDASYIKVGKVVGVLGMDGGSDAQYTTISGAIDDVVTTIEIASASGLDTTLSYYLIDDEIISATRSGTTLTATRGLFGTAAASHLDGATIYFLPNKVTKVMAVNGTTVTLQDSSDLTLTNTLVGVGSTNIKLTGTLTIDGQHYRTFAREGSNPAGFGGTYVTNSTVDKDVLIKNMDFGGVNLTAGWNNQIGGSYSGIGRPGEGFGFTIILFGQSKYNLVNPSSIFDSGEWGISIDDRTTSAAINDGAGEYNIILSGPITASTSIAYGRGIGFGGGRNNTAYVSSIYTPNSYGVYFSDDSQWPNPYPAMNNKVIAGNITGGPAIFDAASRSYNNFVEVASTSGAITIPGGTGVQQGFNFLGPSVGVGTLAPSGKLSVQGDGTGTGKSFLVSNSASTTNFTVLDNGRTGIMVATPSAPLHIATTSNSNATVQVCPSGLSSAITDFSTRYQGCAFTFSRPSDGGNNMHAIIPYQTTGQVNKFAILSRGDIVFGSGGGSDYTAAPEIARITSTGLGIGTTSPGTKLGVVGDAFITGRITTANIFATSSVTISTTTPGFDPHAGGATLKINNQGLGAEASLFTAGSDASSIRSGISFIRSTGSLESPATVANGSKVGFFGFKGYDGTSAPLTGLVEGVVDGAVSAGVVPMSISIITGTTAANRTARLTVSSAGIVTIPYASTTAISSSILADGCLTASSTLIVSTGSPCGSGGSGTPGGSDTEVQFNDASSFGGDAGFTYNKTADRATVTYASTTALTSGNTFVTGNLGVKMSVASAPLEVATTTDAMAKVRIGTVTTVANTDFVQRFAGVANTFSRAHDGSSNISAIFQYQTSGLLNRFGLATRGDIVLNAGGGSDYSAAPERLRIVGTNGYVGIGTSTPGTALGLVGDAYITGRVTAANFVATSTLTTNIFPYASTTAVSGDAVCIGSDCRTSWPSSSAVGGADTQVQFNDGGSALGGDAGFTYNKTADRATITYASTTALSVEGRTIAPTYDKSVSWASSTPDSNFRTYSTATSSRIIWLPTLPIGLSTIGCKVTKGSGTAHVAIGNGTASTTLPCTTTYASASSAITWTAGSSVYIAASSTAPSGVDDLVITGAFYNQ